MLVGLALALGLHDGLTIFTSLSSKELCHFFGAESCFLALRLKNKTKVVSSDGFSCGERKRGFQMLKIIFLLGM